MKTTDKRDRTTTHIAAVTVLGTGVLGSQIAYQTAYLDKGKLGVGSGEGFYSYQRDPEGSHRP